ncbi:uncharacterized protein LOC133189818 [Saccostrea echinata]|uniref:uncharacterized protein LOC133189818 n=1 Tax=Saccostrea echinata TaxID=191078 RepID=UPI002A80D2AD|nr:uncharacterized protein LOC133189818 [Saccostrea echinata]
MDFVPLSDSTLYKIMSTCSASKRTSLCGLDNIATDGAAAIDDLIHMCEHLKELGSEINTVTSLTSDLKNLKMYLKSEYKFSVGLSRGCQDHCIKFALSHPSNVLLQEDFNVSIGMKIKRKDVLKSEQLDTGLIILSDFEEPPTKYGMISSQRKENCSDPHRPETRIFHCSELGCNQQFSSYELLKEHMDLDRHVQEKTSTFDEIRHLWSETCHSNLFKSKQLHQIGAEYHSLEDSNLSGKKLPQGWALKIARKFARFSTRVKEFLQRVYHEGEESGRKAIPIEVAQRMRSLRDSNGEKFFSSEEWLQPSQINSYFGRLSLNGKASGFKEELENDEHLREILQSIEEEEERENIRNTLLFENSSTV